MGELLFVGLGLFDEKDLSLRAWEELAKCDRVLVEQYTSRWAPGAIDRLARKLGQPVGELSREALEGETPVLAALEAHERVALLVVGEPFAATTHVALRLSVESKGHRWRVLHNASILTAAASLSGLSHYKFGRTVSLPKSSESYRPLSPYEGIRGNREAGLHTLVLLDLDPTTQLYLSADQALRDLAVLEAEQQRDVLPPDREVVVVARAGSPDAGVWAGSMKDLARKDFGAPLHCLIVPAPSLHFLEEEAMRPWRAKALDLPVRQA